MKPGSKGWKKFMAKLYGWGASLVIIGALFKIEHWKFASTFLILGLSTEAVIFFFSAFEPIHEEYDWSLVYPELASGEHGESDNRLKGGTVTEQLDQMLIEAKVEPELIASLGDGLRSLSTQAGQLNDLTGASIATDDYVSKVSTASEKVGELTDSYSRAAQVLSGITESGEAGQLAGEQLTLMSNNLSELNSVYELQLASTKEKLSETDRLFDGINVLMQNLNDSVDDTEKYKHNIAKLSKNLSALNNVYGNMLSAMNVNPNEV